MSENEYVERNEIYQRDAKLGPGQKTERLCWEWRPRKTQDSLEVDVHFGTAHRFVKQSMAGSIGSGTLWAHRLPHHCGGIRNVWRAPERPHLVFVVN